MTFLRDLPGEPVRGVRVETGYAELIADPDLPDSWTLVLDGMPQSHVHLDDPTMIAFDYIRRIVDIIDVFAPEGPLRVLHLGGGAFTLPRCLGVLRPGSEQLVVEIDAALVDVVCEVMPVRQEGITITIGDALAALETAEAASYDVIVADVFTGARVPGHVTTAHFASLAARALDRDGIYIANIIDRAPLGFARQFTGTLQDVFGTVALLAEAAVLRGRRNGNLLLIGGDTRLDIAGLVRRAALDPFPVRVDHGERLTTFAHGRPR